MTPTDAERYLFERYVERDGDGRTGALLRAYYGVRPYIPRRAQIAMRRVYARHQRARFFPHLPIETVLFDAH